MVLIERDGRVATVWLNRPQKRNALNVELVSAVTDALLSLSKDEGIGVVLLRGKGPDFCAGADLKELEAVTTRGREASLADARRLGDLFILMRRFSKPIVAAVQGRAVAGGCGLATACDLVVASSDAELGYPEVRLGFVPAMAMAILRRKLTEGRAFELVTLGERISAPQAHQIGLVNRVFPPEEFEDALSELARELSSRPASALALTKGLLYELDSFDFDQGIQRGAEVNVEARETEACREGVREFLERTARPEAPEEVG
jgi:methylglutaconyl-CoA hydratase